MGSARRSAARRMVELSCAAALVLLNGAAAAVDTCAVAAEHGGMRFPVDRLDQRSRCVVGAVVNDFTTSGLMGPIQTPIAQHVFEYLLDKPMVFGALVQRFNLGTYRFVPKGERIYWVDDGEGTQGLLTLVYRDDTSRIYHLDGYHEGSLLPMVKARAVVFLRLQSGSTSDGHPSVQSNLVAYTKLKNPVLAAMMKVLRPLVGGAVTRKLSRGFDVAFQMSNLIAQDPERVAREAKTLTGIDAEDLKSLTALLLTMSPPVTARSRARHPMTLERRFRLLCIVGVCCFISYNLVRMPVLSLFAESLGAGPEAIGAILSLSTLTGVLLKLPSGGLSDIYGRRALMQVGVLAFGLPPFIYPFVDDLHVLMGLRFIHGLATAIFAPTALATVADMYREQRGAALGIYTASTQAGALLGPVIGGWLVYVAGFPITFVTAGLFGCLGVAVFFALRLTPPPAGRREKGLVSVVKEVWKGVRVVVGNTRALVTSCTDAAKMIANGALMAFLPIYGLSVGLNPGEVGVLFGVQGVTSFLSKPIMGRTSDRVGRRPLIMLGLAVCAGTFVMIPHASQLPVLLMLAAGFGFGEAVVSSSTTAMVADLSELRTLGAGIGMQGTIMDIGHASGPLLAGMLIAHLSYQSAFSVIAGIQVAAMTAFWVMTRSSSA